MFSAKKQILKKILTALVPYRELAEWFLMLVDENGDEKLLNVLYTTIYNEIKNINNEKDIKNIKTALKKIKEKEDNENNKEWEYLENLIDNI